MKKQVISKNVQEPCGSYSQAIISTGTQRLYMSCLTPKLPAGMDKMPDNIEEQGEILLNNIDEMLKENDFCLNNIVSLHVYLKNDTLFKGFNKAYERIMPKPFPARTALISDNVDNLLEIDLIAEK